MLKLMVLINRIGGGNILNKKKKTIKNFSMIVFFILLIIVLLSPINSFFSDILISSQSFSTGNLAVRIENLKIYDGSTTLSNHSVPDENHETGISIGPNEIRLFTFDVRNNGLSGMHANLYFSANFDSVLKEKGIVLLFPSNIDDQDIIDKLKIGDDSDAVIKLDANDNNLINSTSGTYNGIKQKIDDKRLDSSLANGTIGIATIPGESFHHYEYKLVLFDNYNLDSNYGKIKLEINLTVEAKLHNLEHGGWVSRSTDIFRVKVDEINKEKSKYFSFTHPKVEGLSTKYQTVYFGGHKWMVLDNGEVGEVDNKGSLVLLSRGGIGNSIFNWELGTSSHLYKDSVIETYIDNWQLSNLSTLEASSIIGQKVTNPDGSGNARTINDKENGKKLFLLSAEETANWGADPLSSILPSSYFPSGNIDRVLSERWWLRSRSRATSEYIGYYASAVSVVNEGDMYVGAGGINGTGNYIGAEYIVRPATKIDLSKILFITSTIGTSRKTNIGEGNFTFIPSNLDSVKLTLIDSSRKLTISDTIFGTAVAGNNLEATVSVGSKLSLGFDVSNTTLGTGNYISAIVKYDSNNDNIPELYYSKIEVSGSTLIIPTHTLPVGEYEIQLFSEKIDSNDINTDYASKPISLFVTINP